MTLDIQLEGYGLVATGDEAGSPPANWGVDGSGGVSISENTETYIQGVQSVGSKIAAGKYGWIYYDIGTADRALDFDTAGTEEGEYLYIWVNCTTLGGMSTIATPGISIRIGTDDTDWREWVLGGSDGYANAWTGGWLCCVIDPTSAGTQDGGTYDPGVINWVGAFFDSNIGSVAQNCFVDTIICASGLRITQTEAVTGEGWKEVVEYCNDTPTTRVWGIMQRGGGIYNFYGKAYIGDPAQTEDTDFTGVNYVVKWRDFEYYNSDDTTIDNAISDGFNGLIIEDDETFETFFKDGLLVGSDNGRAGSIFIGSDRANTTFVLYGGLIGTSTTKLYGSTLINITGGITWGDDSDHHCYGVSFTGCGQFDPVGGVIIRNCTFSATVDSFSGGFPNGSALLWNASINIQNCSFIANTDATYDPHAIEHPDDGTFGYTSLKFSGNDYDIHFTDTADNLIINATNSDPGSYENESTGTVTINVAADVAIEVVDPFDVAVVGAQVFVEADSGGTYPSYEVVLITSSGTTATVDHTDHDMFDGQLVCIRNANEIEYNGVFAISYIGVDSYSYTMTGDPADTATGTITATFVLLNKLTIAGGIASDSVKVVGSQPVQGHVRYQDPPIHYKEGPLSGDFDSDGFGAKITLVDDS